MKICKANKSPILRLLKRCHIYNFLTSKNTKKLHDKLIFVIYRGIIFHQIAKPYDILAYLQRKLVNHNLFMLFVTENLPAVFINLAPSCF